MTTAPMSSSSAYVRPKFSFIEEDRWSIEYTGRAGACFVVNNKQLEELINCPKRFTFDGADDRMPSYVSNTRSVSLLEFLHGANPLTKTYIFHNGDRTDVRTSNIEIRDHALDAIFDGHDVVRHFGGTVVTRGRYAGQTKNRICEVKTTDSRKTRYLMSCNGDKLCILCPTSHGKILEYEKEHGEKIVWSYHRNGYVLGNNNLYIHQVITGCYGNGKGTKTISVDHIDQNPLNNTFDNLRVVPQAVQMGNSKGIKEGTKRARKKDAIPLPEGITEDMIPKYATYYLEPYGTGGKTRSFFRVEKHPALVGLGKRDICTSKSNKVADQDKLAQAAEIVEALDAGTYVEKQSPLPMYFSMIHMREKPHLVYERRLEDGTRQNLKMVLPAEYDVGEQLERMRTKLTAKYGGGFAS